MLDRAYRIMAVSGAEDRLAAALDENAAASRKEPGVLFFEVLRSTDPGVVLVVERYADDAAYEAHKQTSHFATWKQASGALVASVERFNGSAEA